MYYFATENGAKKRAAAVIAGTNATWSLPPVAVHTTNGWAAVGCRLTPRSSNRMEWVVWGKGGASVLVGNPAALERETGITIAQSADMLKR